MIASEREVSAVETIEYNGWFTLQWHITHRCNLRCTHCYQDDYTAFESADALFDVLGQYETLLRENRFKGFLNITGGEPLTHPELFRLLEEAKKRGVTTAVLTNGTLIGRVEAMRLKACGVDYVQVSLDGTEKTHDAIRGKGSFARAVSGIHALLAQNIFTDVSFTAQRENKDELPALARYCSDIGVDKLWFDRVVIPAAEDEKHLSLTKEEFKKLSRQAARLNRRRMVSCARALQFIPCKSKSVYQSRSDPPASDAASRSLRKVPLRRILRGRSKVRHLRENRPIRPPGSRLSAALRYQKRLSERRAFFYRMCNTDKTYCIFLEYCTGSFVI